MDSLSKTNNQKKLKELFPVILIEDLDKELESEKEKNYKKQTLSLFDHWLNEEEADKQILSYPVVREDSIKLEQYLRQEQQFLSMFEYLYKNYEILNFIENEKTNDGDFYDFKNLESFLTVCQKSLREERFFRLVILELKMIIMGNFDLTLPVLYQDEKNINKIMTIANNFRLNLLV